MHGPDRTWLQEGGVEVWLAVPGGAAEAAAEPLLSRAERRRAARFTAPEARARYVVGRGLMRWGLGRLIGVEPPAVAVAELPTGKPTVAVAGPRFNVAHSGRVVLAAFAWRRDVGVDVEQVRTRDELRVAARHFRPAEVAAIEAAGGGARTALFTRCWTRKEALLKAEGGHPLLVGLSRLEQPFALDRAWEAYAHEGRVWAVGDVPLPLPDHLAAVAVEGSALRLRVHTWQP